VRLWGCGVVRAGSLVIGSVKLQFETNHVNTHPTQTKASQSKPSHTNCPPPSRQPPQRTSKSASSSSGSSASQMPSRSAALAAPPPASWVAAAMWGEERRGFGLRDVVAEEWGGG